MMKNIMFVCHGNICRSPMAEYIMKDIVCKKGLQNEFHISSSATSSEETGNSLYPPAARVLALHNVTYGNHRARRFTVDDYHNYDMVIVMEQYNIGNLMRIITDDKNGKVWKLLDFVEDDIVRCKGDDISDPWYHDNFEKTYKEITAGCNALLEYLTVSYAEQ